jgi:hypothetical protein
VPLTSISTTSSNTITISGELRLRGASNQIAMNIRTASSASDINSSITGGTINNSVINSISPYKYYNFNILPNINNLVNGTLTFNVLLPTGTGWYGNLYIYNENLGIGGGSPENAGGPGRYFYFNASDANGKISVSNQIVNAGATYTIEVLPGNRLPNMNSVITFQVTSYQENSELYQTASLTNGTYIGATQTSFLYSGVVYITATTAGVNMTIKIPVINQT